MTGRPAAFLDRDGTIIEDRCYIASPDDVALIPGAASGLAALRDRGLLLVVVSNQSGVARGLIDAAAAEAVHRRVVATLRDEGVDIDGSYYCPHGPGDGCDCRKPAPGLVLRAAADLDIDLGASIVIGDRRRDLEAGLAAGCGTAVLLAPPAGERPPKEAVELAGWPELVDWLASR